MKNVGVEDIVLLSDVDEIPNINFMESIQKLAFGDFKISKMNLYYYVPHFKSKQEWFGSIASKGMPKVSFQELRSLATEIWKLHPEDVVELLGCTFLHLEMQIYY